MKHSILNWILGASLVIAAPAAMADNSWKKNKNANKHNKHFVEKPHKHNNYCVQNGHNTRFQNNNNYTWSSNKWNNRHDRRNAMRRAIQRIHKRQNNQARRINRGIDNGQLVRREVRTLRKEQRRISERLRHFQNDGRLNRHEQNKINNMLDVASNHIRNKRHNRLTQRSQYNNNQYGYNQHNQYSSPEDLLYEFVSNW